jgi:hypothetical protein
MQYRGIRYTIKTRTERNEWLVAIHPDGTELPGKVFLGTREAAELRAHSIIGDWLQRHSRKANEPAEQ